MPNLKIYQPMRKEKYVWIALALLAVLWIHHNHMKKTAIFKCNGENNELAYAKKESFCATGGVSGHRNAAGKFVADSDAPFIDLHEYLDALESIALTTKRNALAWYEKARSFVNEKRGQP